jgi:signal transduction histidine kinase
MATLMAIQPPPNPGPSSRCALLIESYEQAQGQLACDLHDGIGQILGAMKYRLEGAVQMVSDGDATGAQAVLSGIVARLQSAIEEVRRVAMRLRPSILDDLGLIPTIEWFARDFQATYAGTRVVTRVQAREGDVPEPLKLVIYRVMQEALHNVAKHACAREVRVALTRTGPGLTLRIADDGRGFDPGAVPVGSARGGIGLGGMRERVEQSGGVLSVQSSVGGGTVVTASWAGAPVSAAYQPVLDGEGGQGRGAV